MIFRKDVSSIPELPGVYMMKDRRGDVIYIGKAKSLRNRLIGHFNPTSGEQIRHASMMSNLQDVDYLITQGDREALILENELIKYFRPKYNVNLRDDKTYPMIKLSIHEDFPRFSVVRKRSRDGSVYFGPYPDAGSLKQTLHIVNRIFPTIKCNKSIFHVRNRDGNPHRCIYFHMKQCFAPCCGLIGKDEYRKIVAKAVLFMKGKREFLLKKLHQEMTRYAQVLEFEKAQIMKEEIEAVQKITKRINFRKIEKGRLAIIKKAHSILISVKKILGLGCLPYRIEAFDVSQLRGENAVGSMVVFINGRPARDQYRRYRIKGKDLKDDVSMMVELVNRRYGRLLREGRRLPDLILIDGGRAQVSAAVRTLENMGLALPVIGLAKKEETIIFPKERSALRLQADSEVLCLLMFIRDESHRFAIKYHKYLRRNVYRRIK